MGTPIDIHGTHAADPFTAIMVKSDRIFSFTDQFFVENVEHFKEGHFRRDIFHLVGNKSTGISGILLPPYLKGQIHGILFHI
jgi:hypothetical protein